MLKFILKRLILMFVTMTAASFLLFIVLEFSPTNLVSSILGQYASEESKAILAEKMQLGDPVLVRYFRWVGILSGVLDNPLADPSLKLNFDDPRGPRYFGNFGHSTLLNQPVLDVIGERIRNSAVLAGLAFAILVPLSMLFGILAGMNEGGRLDRALSITCITLSSIPEFAMAVFLLFTLVVGLGILPGISNLETGSGWSVASQMVLPVAVLVLFDFGYVARMVRASMVEVMTQPYISTAILKGLPRRKVVLVHALRNAMIVPFTVIMLQLNWLISGVVVAEVVFGYPGFGKMVLDAALYGDIAVLEAATMFAILMATMTQSVSDIGYMILNPRIRLS